MFKDEPIGYILVNFGGPRDLQEIKPFLTALLTDRDVIQTSWPDWLHRLFFTWVARKRVSKVAQDYQAIGGKSPIFEDTEALAHELSSRWQTPVIAFHRYLPATHPHFLRALSHWKGNGTIRVVPLFPQFSYTTTGSIARWFATHIPQDLLEQIEWIKSYPEHPGFIYAYQSLIRRCLDEQGWQEEETLLLFSAHGLPQRYVQEGDPYQEECERSFRAVATGFPQAGHQLCYQSLFGKEEWLRPYTVEFCAQGDLRDYRHVIVVPLSFTSDHIETLFEIEQQHLPLLRNRGVQAIRCPALNQDEVWIDGLIQIASQVNAVSTNEDEKDAAEPTQQIFST